jgi:hypothetical protein
MGIIIAYMTPFLDKQPYHTSVLTGHAWVQELINGHPDWIKTELGMRKHVFHALLHELWTCGLCDSKYILLDEQVAVFLYTCVTGQGFQAVMLQNVFSTPTQPCRSTFMLLQDIHCLTYHIRYFKRVLLALSLAPFYNKFVCLLREDAPIPAEISGNPKLFLHFEGVWTRVTREVTHYYNLPCHIQKQTEEINWKINAAVQALS